jgi:hypothetical protein
MEPFNPLVRHLVFASITLLPLASATAQCGPSMVTTAAGDTVLYTCPGDQMADLVPLMNTATPGQEFAYIVTDANNIILAVPGAVTEIDVEEAGVGVCRVYGVTYQGTLTAEEGQNVTMADLATGCEQLSSNFISLYRDMPNGGTVSLVGGGTTTTVVAGDGMPDLVLFDSSGTSLSLYAWIITDANSMILGVEYAPMHDFEPAGPGTCLVYGVSYTGTLNAPMGQDVTLVELSDDCWDLSSNFITVVRLSVGIGELEAASPLRLFPTVTDDLLTVELGDHAARSLLFHAMNGQVVKTVPVAGSTGNVVVAVNDLAPGVYTCTLVSDTGLQRGRFVHP